MKVGVLGAGTMGAGIAQVAAQAGHQVVLVDLNQSVLDKAKVSLEKIMDRLIEKGKNEILHRIQIHKQRRSQRTCPKRRVIFSKLAHNSSSLKDQSLSQLFGSMK